MPKTSERTTLIENYIRRHEKRSTKPESELMAAAKKYADGVLKRRGKSKKPVVKKATRQAKRGKAGSYLTTRGTKQRILDEAVNYTME